MRTKGLVNKEEDNINRHSRFRRIDLIAAQLIREIEGEEGDLGGE